MYNSVYIIDISVVFITFMLLFTFNLGFYSANAIWHNKIPRYGHAMTTPSIDYALYLDDYDMVVLYYNTLAM